MCIKLPLPPLSLLAYSSSSGLFSAAGATAPMPQGGHERPALVGPAAGWQLGGGLVRGQLHHRAGHRRVLQHGAGRGSGDGRRAGGRRLSSSAAVPGAWTWLSACIWGILSPGPESTYAPFSARSFQLSICPSLLFLRPTSGLGFFLLSFLSHSSMVFFGPHPSWIQWSASANLPVWVSFGRRTCWDNWLSPLGSLWRDALGSHCAFLT